MTSTRPVWHKEAAALRTGCKLNLFLNICGLRPDGYHELQTLFYPLLEPFDTLYVRPSPDSGLKLICPAFPALETEKTTLHKAMEAFYREFGQSLEEAPGYEIFLHKRVPAGGGLGGGSANAAGFLRYLNESAGKNALGFDALLAVAAKVGADVPFFLMNGPALAEGVGERLTPVYAGLAGYSLVLVCPGIHVSTQWAYREWDKLAEAGKMQGSFLQRYFYQYLTNGEPAGKNLPVCWPWFYNNLEPAVFPAHPEIAALKECLLKCGAKAALMSGSGSSVFGIFKSPLLAEKAAGAKEFAACQVLLGRLSV